MTEHSAVIFVFFFLAEYASIVLICILNSIFFLGGYLWDFNIFINPFVYLLQFFQFDNSLYLADNAHSFKLNDLSQYGPVIETAISAIILGFKTCFMIFVFI